MACGNGIYVINNIYKYKGEFYNDYKNGYRVEVWKNIATYKGDF